MPHEIRQLAAYLNLSPFALDSLEARLPWLRWVKQDGTYAMLDENSDKLTLTINRATAKYIAASLIDKADEDPDSAAARELHRLMTEYVPDRVPELLMAMARPVVIGTDIFHLPVTTLDNGQPIVRLDDGRRIKLAGGMDGRPYWQEGEVMPTAGNRSADADTILVGPASETIEFDWHDEENELLGSDYAFDLDPQIKLEADEDSPWTVSAGKRAASASPEGAPPRQRRLLDMMAPASERWAAYQASIAVRLPEWDQLKEGHQLCLLAAAASVPDSTEAGQSPANPGEAQARVREHRDRRFTQAARSVAGVTRRQHHSIETLQERIDKLPASAGREFVQGLLDRASADPSLEGRKPNTLQNGNAVKELERCLRFLEKLRTKAPAARMTGEDNTSEDETGVDWLNETLAGLLAKLPEEQRAAPDADTSKRCIQHLGKALGIKSMSGRVAVKGVINHLSGVDLTFHNANHVPSTPSTDNPIPRTTNAGSMLRNHFERLKLPQNRLRFAGFFEDRNSEELRSAQDPAGKNAYSAAVTESMQLLLGLEKRTDDKGEPAPQDIESVLKSVFGPVFGTVVDDWKALPKPTPEQVTNIREELKRLPEIKADNLRHYLPIILHITGISLWTTKPRPKKSKAQRKVG